MSNCSNYIGGQWLPAATGKTFVDRNPADREDVLGHFPASDRADVDLAVAAARKAFDSWSTMPAPRRGELLFRVAERLAQCKEELAALVVREMGKSPKEGIGDVQEAIDLAYYMGGETRRMFGQVTNSELPSRLVFAVRIPVGVVAAITPWNFPIGILAMKIMPALACGNTVVLKPAEDSPLCANRLLEIFVECGLPPGVFNIVHGIGEIVGRALVSHQDVDLVSFTGSSEVGAEIGGVCGRAHKRVCLEMGGKNAIVVLEDADLDAAVEGAAWAAFGTTGQRCTAASRLIVDEKLVGEFSERVAAKAKALKVGNHAKGNIDVGPLINDKQLQRVARFTETGLSEGARLLAGGEVLRDGELARGSFYSPTVFTDVRSDMRIAQEEIFGPTAAVISVRGFDEALATLNGVGYGLSCAVFTRDVNNAFRFLERSRAGIAYINSHTIGAEAHLPFGGIKHSGNGGREGGWTAVDVYTEWKTVYADYSQRLQRPMVGD